MYTLYIGLCKSRFTLFSSSSSSSSLSALLLWSWIQFKDYINGSKIFSATVVCLFFPALLSMSEQIYCIPKLHHKHPTKSQQRQQQEQNFCCTCTPASDSANVAAENILASKLFMSLYELYSLCTNAVSFYTVAKIWTECLMMELEVFQYV